MTTHTYKAERNIDRWELLELDGSQPSLNLKQFFPTIYFKNINQLLKQIKDEQRLIVHEAYIQFASMGLVFDEPANYIIIYNGKEYKI